VAALNRAITFLRIDQNSCARNTIGHSLRIPFACHAPVIKRRRFGGAAGNILRSASSCAALGWCRAPVRPANGQLESGLVLQWFPRQAGFCGKKIPFFQTLGREVRAQKCEFETVNAEAPANTI
jgi:hypothetical protein